MSLRLYAINCGWQTGPLGLFLAGEHGRIRVPTPCYLIDHPKGKVLFDSGLHVDLQHDPAARLGIIATVFDVQCRPGDEVRAQLAALDVDAASIRFLVTCSSLIPMRDQLSMAAASSHAERGPTVMPPSTARNWPVMKGILSSPKRTVSE